MAIGWKKFTGKSQYPELASNNQQSAFTYGSKRDRNFRMNWIQGRKNEVEEKELIDWINYVTSENIDYQDPLKYLNDGKILCKLLLRINPNCLLQPINQKPAIFSATENANNFLTSLKSCQFINEELFDIMDLVEQRDFTSVCKTLKLLKERAPNIQKLKGN